jgi:hypothetical protein
MQLKPYYYADADGFLVSTLHLTDEQAAQRPDLLTEMPPERPRPVVDEQAERIAAARAYALRTVNADRDALLNANVFFDGTEAQADQRSRLNMTEKIAEIDAATATGSTLPQESLFWRDALNQNRTFETQVQYRDWLSGVLAEISRRNTEVLVDVWRKKELIAACADHDQILAIPNSISGYVL